MDADGYVVSQQPHTLWQELMVPKPKNSSHVIQDWSGRSMCLMWPEESSPRKVRSEEIIFPAKLRSETWERALRIQKTMMLNPTKITVAQLLKRQGLVSITCPSSHLSPRSHSLHMRCLPRPGLDTGNATLSKAGLVSVDGLSIPSLSIRRSVIQTFTKRPSKGLS